MSRGRRVSHPAARRQSGRTLVELMVSVTIGLMLIGALLAIYRSTGATARQSVTVSRMNEDAALALSLLSSSLRMAGFSLPRENMPPATATMDGQAVATPDRHFIGAGIRGCDQGFANAGSADAFADRACASRGASAAFSVRFEGQTDGLAPELRNTLLSDGQATDCLVNGVDATADSAWRPGLHYTLVESRYFVQVGASSGTPELYCAGNGGAGSPQPLVQYVEELRISYGVGATPADSQVARYLTAAQVDALGGSVDERWSRVISVDLCIVMRSEGKNEAGAGPYLDCTHTPKPSPGGFLRRAYRTTVTLRNRAAPA